MQTCLKREIMCENKEIKPHFTEEELNRLVRLIHDFFPNYDINDAILHLENNGLTTDLKNYDNGDVVFSIASRYYKEKL